MPDPRKAFLAPYQRKGSRGMLGGDFPLRGILRVFVIFVAAPTDVGFQASKSIFVDDVVDTFFSIFGQTIMKSLFPFKMLCKIHLLPDTISCFF